jgi:hypothetical protein
MLFIVNQIYTISFGCSFKTITGFSFCVANPITKLRNYISAQCVAFL